MPIKYKLFFFQNLEIRKALLDKKYLINFSEDFLDAITAVLVDQFLIEFPDEIPQEID